ncbi:sensor histidine kinase [Nesterenkonia xinjiangensis]|uniref:histidine kinase n=1 Tax=Nesterenkonia xinjiangensis TaxID=225327 RepID=A0A7Z0K9H6_9MICC|nr:sensor histidine kinase [Nesterenkonia xinjiangensis]NYJ78711.1 signal transduction histidine kinase [Nesterenkonia xinjiangensis]
MTTTPQLQASTTPDDGVRLSLRARLERMVTELISVIMGWAVWMLPMAAFLLLWRFLTFSPGAAGPGFLGGIDSWPLAARLAAVCVTTVVVLPAAARIADQLQFSRATHLLGETLNPPPTPEGKPWWRCLVLAKDRTKPGMLGRSLGGALASSLLAAGAVLCTVTAAVLLMLLLTSDAAFRNSTLFDSSTRLLLTVPAVATLIASPWIIHGLSELDRRLLRTFYGTDEAAQLQARIRQADQARSDAVDTADAERRRIERDLHDGAQQRLTALAVDLGLSRRMHAQDPEELRETLVRAQGEVTSALQEIRDLVRGLHPAVLEDRGLDAAVSALADRAPFPVTVHIDVDPRPAVSIEAVAYFVVAEALNNAMRHAGPRRAEVTILRDGGELRVTVGDDGVGGADTGAGTGLSGLRRRVNAVNGWLEIHSPDGGGTTVTAVLPCE